MTSADSSLPTTPSSDLSGDALAAAILRSKFAGDDLRGNLPKMPVRASLTPLTAAEPRRGRVVYVPGASGVADALYVCMKSAADTYSWVRMDTGAVVDLSAIDFLVGTASGLLSAEIAVGATPGGELGGTWPSPTVDATHSGSAHAIILRGGSAATEATTVSTSAVDLVTIASLNIPVTSGIIIEGVVRKSAGAAAYAGLGLKLNSTVVSEARSDGTTLSFMQLSNTNGAESGNFRLQIMPRSANYLTSGQAVFVSALGGVGYTPRFGNLLNDAFYPNAAVTTLAIRGITASASQTLAVRDLAVYEVLYA